MFMQTGTKSKKTQLSGDAERHKKSARGGALLWCLFVCYKVDEYGAHSRFVGTLGH